LPLYEDLVRRALAAQSRAASLGIDAKRARDFAQLLREAHAGKRLLRHCAWCDRLEVAGEWLQLDAIGHGQVQIATALLKRSSHGICPDCFPRVLEQSNAERAERAATA
jgi:hypothetical protein